MQDQAALQTASKIVRPAFPLSYPQERLWFQYLLEGPSCSFNYPVYYRIRGSLDRGLLARSLEKVFAHHEIFRSRFTVVNGTPRFYLSDTLELPMDFLDLSSELPEPGEEKLQQVITSLSLKTFHLEKDIPFRVTLIRVSETYHVLMLNFHHIIMDGITMEYLDEEIRKVYQDLSSGVDEPPGDPESTYTTQVMWQREAFSEASLQDHFSFWQEYLENSNPLVDLPMDRRKKGTIPVNTASMTRYLSKELCEVLKIKRRDLGVSRFIIMLSTFYAFLYSYTGQKDLIAGCATSGRFDPTAEKAVGFFANTIPVRACPNETMSLRGFVTHVNNSFQKARTREIPYQLIVQGSNPDRQLSSTPLFNMGVSFFRDPIADRTHGGISFQGPNTITFSSGVDLLFLVYLQGDDMLVKFNYSPDLFEEATIERMMDSWFLLLETLLEKPEMAMKDLPFIVNSHVRQYLVHHGAEHPLPPFRPLHELFIQRALSSPHAPALILSGRIMNYAELNARSDLLAGQIAALGLERQIPVGICMERSMEMVISLLAVMKAGFPWLALDPSFPETRLSFMLEDSCCSLVLTEKGKSLSMPEGIAVIEVNSGKAIELELPSPDHGIQVQPDDLAYIIYTSGSTGTPKGVMIEHRSLSNYILWHSSYFDFTPADVTLLKTPFTFDPSLWELLAPLITGGSIVILETGKDYDMEHIAGLIRINGISMLNSVPAFLDSLLDLAAPGDLTSLKKVLCGAEAWKVSLLEKFNYRSGGTLHNIYGPTETTIAVTCWKSSRDNLPPHIPMGEAIAGARLYILDERMRPLPAGVPGELYVAGPGLARGYLNSPDLEKEKFVTPEGCPFGEERFYRTGDLVRRGPGGDLVFIGRVDDQVKIRGFRIELGDIESSLDEHPGIARSVVAVKEEGSSTRQLWAFYRTDHDKPLEEGELREFLAMRLPAYMIPSRFIHVEKFPLTAHGKMDRKRLVTEAGSLEGTELPVTPRTGTEKRLFLIWEKLLGMTPPGVRSNFFSLGGHSLMAARLFSEIEREFGTKLPLSLIFREGTIEALSLAIEERRVPWPFECLVPLRTEGQGTPLFLLHAVKGEVYAYMDLVERLPEGYPVYAFQPPGFAGGDKLPRGIEWMVSTYLEELERFMPHGPYLLAGHSFGGLVAYEMAARLAGKGKDVPYLAVFDTTLEFETLPFLLTKGSFLPEEYRRKRISRKISSIPDRLFEYLKFHARYLAARLLLKMKRPVPFMKKLIRYSNRKEGMNHTPSEYPGDLIIFRARDSMFRKRTPTLGWERYVKGKIKVIDVSGDHANLARGPHAEDLARVFAESLPEI